VTMTIIYALHHVLQVNQMKDLSLLAPMESVADLYKVLVKKCKGNGSFGRSRHR
jgi:hypothetical protein